MENREDLNEAFVQSLEVGFMIVSAVCAVMLEYLVLIH
jgi:hypothetical protein